MEEVVLGNLRQQSGFKAEVAYLAIKVVGYQAVSM
jgi:hypothetical protein